MTAITEGQPMASDALPKPSSDKLIRSMVIVCLIGLGTFLFWGSFAPLEEGIAANGQIVVDGDKQVIQHLEGGIVESISVRDGQFVRKGQTLLVLQRTAPLASRDLVVQEYAALAASVERMRALQTGQRSLTFAALDDLDLGDAERLDIMRREEELFQQQRASIGADITVLRARRSAAVKTQQTRAGQIGIARKGLGSAQQELNVIKSMFAQQLARRDQVTAAERLVSSFEADIARLASEQQEARANEQDLAAQIAQADASFSQDNGAALLEASAQLLSAEERLQAAQDVLDRAIIKAPVDGEILNLEVATLGGVVQPGQTMMEIVPGIAEVTASVRVSPSDRSSVFEGQIVRTRFSSYRGWQAPRLEGKIVGVSADLKTDPATSASYYEARVRIPAEQLARTQGVEVIPGMPVDVFIFSGRSRTFLDYLVEPLSESLFKGLRTA